MLLFARVCTAQDAAETGRWTFRILCAPCHGIRAEGGRGPDLTLGTFSAGDRDADLFTVISRGVAGTEMAGYAGRMTDDEIRGVVAYIRLVSHASQKVPGDAAAGETLFWNKGACGACHRVGIRGSSVGPDLSRVGRQRSFEYLKNSLLKPDADVTPGYATVTIETRDGRKIVGVERNFDNFSAQLVDLSGKYYSFEREDVLSMKREPRSLMPSTYGQLFTAAEAGDLLAYLSSMRGAR
jgi:putative heme-binding domain-containing protein